MSKQVQAFLVAVISVLLVVSFSWAASKKPYERFTPEDYPKRAIEITVPFGAGGTVDALCRQVAPLMEKRMGAAVGVVNRPGANSIVNMKYLLSQPADGYLISGLTNDTIAAIAAGTTKIRIKDLVWLRRTLLDIEMFFVRSDDKRFQTWDEYVKYAKAHPGELSMAVAGAGGIEHVVAALVNYAAGVKVKYVPFDVPTERFTAFLGGHTDLLLEEPTDMKAYIEEGKCHPIIQMIEERPSMFKDTPTAPEKGIDVTLALWRGFCMNPAMSYKKINYIYAVIQDCLQDPKYLEWKNKRGYIRPDYDESPMQFHRNAYKSLEQIKQAFELIKK